VPRAALAFPIYAFSLLASIPFAAWFSGPSLAAVSLARFALFGISLCVFFYTLAMPLCASDQLQSLRILFYAGLASASFAVLDFFLQLPAPAGFGAQYVWTAAGIYRRAQGVFYESSTLGNICMFFLLFIAACFARPRNEAPVRRPLLLVGAGVFLAALLLSFSRASLIGLAIGIAALTALQKDWLRMLRLCAVLVGAGLFSLTALYVAMPALVRFYGVRTAASLQLVTSGNERALSGRAETWRVLTAYVRDHPQYAIFGVGYKTLPYSDFIGQTTVADNSYLSALVETGILGLGALLILHAGILRMAWKARASLCGIWILSFWSVEMVQMLSGDLFTYWRALPLYFWVLALAVRSEPKRLP
jgi:O-antigen ligase